MNEDLLRLETFAFHESKEDTRKYLESYWLFERDIPYWREKQKVIFEGNFKTLPSIVFKSSFKRIVMKGGIIFAEEDFKALNSCMKSCGDKHFVIIEDYDENFPPHFSGPSLRLIYPVQITWREMNIPDGICYQLFGRPVRNFFVFGDSGLWGKYVANDYPYPVEIVGYSKEAKMLFESRFAVSFFDKIDLRRNVPELL